MRILSWNIQCGKSCDAVIDIKRTASHIRSLGELDVICLQEVSRNMEEYCAPGQMDQLHLLQDLFSDYTPVWGSGFSWPGMAEDKSCRQEFGNLTLVKPVLLDFKVHPLPRPATPDRRQMQRIAIEATVKSTFGSLGIINTHLAFHDERENHQQVERLGLLEDERHARLESPGEIIEGCYAQKHQTAARILCGDFNFPIDSAQYRYQVERGWIDAWRQANNNETHAPTCGIFDKEQWPVGSHCRDFFWLSKELGDTQVTVDVDSDTNLSDHQPILLGLAI